MPRVSAVVRINERQESGQSDREKGTQRKEWLLRGRDPPEIAKSSENPERDALCTDIPRLPLIGQASARLGKENEGKCGNSWKYQ